MNFLPFAQCCTSKRVGGLAAVLLYREPRGVARTFQRGGAGVTLCQSEGTHQIVMSFSLTKGGVTGTPGPSP